jgi:N,N'-diacetylchitobiose transport system permease protein
LSSVTPIAPTPVAAAVPRAIGRRRRLGSVGWNLVGLLVFVVMIFPVYWMAATAFKPGRDVLRFDPKWIPSPWTLDNFDDAIHRPYFWDNVKNSVIIVSVVVVLSLVIGFLAALAIARFHFYGRKAFIAVIIGVQMIPATALIIPLYVLLARVDQVDRLSGVIVTYLTFVLPFTIWTLRGFVAGVPIELEEAAMVDGCSRVGAFFRITFPLLAPGFVATGVFGFIYAWNEFTLALVVMTRPDHRTLPLWLTAFADTNRGTDWGAIMAGSTLIAIPVIIFFLVVQNRMTAGLTAGAVKG